MKLTSMKRTAAEKKDRERPMAPAHYGGDDYGYGLCISLDKSALEKLGIKPSSFDVGDEVSFEGRGTIKALRQDKSNSYDSQNVEIQITNLGIEAGSAEDAVSRGISKAGK